MSRVDCLMNNYQLQIRVLPNAKREGWVGMWNGTHYKIALRAPAVDGKANEALIEFLANFWKIPKRDFTIVQGKTTRCKVVAIKNLLPEQMALLQKSFEN